MQWHGGGCLNHQHPIEFSSDGNLLLCCSGNFVRVISSATAQQVCLLSGHSREVTSVSVVNLGVDGASQRAWTSSLDGTLKLWDFETGKCLRTLEIGFPVFSMVIPASRFILSDVQQAKSLALEAYLSLELENTGTIIVVNLINGNRLNGHLAKTQTAVKLFLSPRGGYAGFCYMDYITFWKTEKLIQKNKLRKHCLDIEKYVFKWRNKITTLTFSNNELHVAAGDSLGRIGVWYNFHSELKFDSPDASLHRESELELNHGSDDDHHLNTADLIEEIAETEQDTSPQAQKNEKRKSASDGIEKNTPTTKNVQIEKRDRTQMNVVHHNHSKNFSTFHWHASSLNAVCFSRDDLYLLSGGNEAVIVIWQLQTGFKSFIPKLLSPIISIFPHPKNFAVLAVAFQNSCIRFIDISTRKITKSIRGISPLPEAYSKKTTQLNTNEFDLFHPVLAELDPLEGYLILPSMNSSIQFFNIKSDAHVSNLQVTPRNFIMRTNENNPSDEIFEYPFTVTHVTISRDGKSIVTAETKFPEGDIGQAFTLKFWVRSRNKFANEPFSLNTCVENAHEKSITSVAYHPTEDMVITTSLDAVFKIWVKLLGKSGQRKSNENDADLPFCWRCRSAGDYLNHPFYASAFSCDGSLLGVAASSAITIFNPYSNGLICVIQNPIKEQVVSRIAFIHDSPFLVTTTEDPMPMISVINILTLSVSWSFHLRVKSLAVDSCSSKFAIIASFTFDKHSSSPVDSGQDSNANDDEEAYIIVFDSFSPLPLCAWRLTDFDKATLLFSPPGLIEGVGNGEKGGGEETHDHDEDVLYEIGSDLIVLTRNRRYIVLNPMEEIAAMNKRENQGTDAIKYIKEMAIVDSSLTTNLEKDLKVLEIEKKKVKSKSEVKIVEKKLMNYESTYGKLPTEEDLKKEVKNVHGIQSLKPWGDMLNGSSHVLPPLIRIYPSFMDAMLQKHNTPPSNAD